jgi:hypothetical protein
MSDKVLTAFRKKSQSIKKNVLVFPCGSEIGLEIHRSLSFSTHFNLFGGSSVSDHGEYVYQNYIGDIPIVESVGFLDTINKVIKENAIDFIIPAHDSVLLALALERFAGKLDAALVASPLDTCELTRSKSLTYKRFSGVIPTPEIYDPSQTAVFPVFLKPDIGQGSKGTYTANSVTDVAFYLSKDPTLLVLEYLPGKEYTIDCFTNRDGNLLFAEGRERSRISNGISVNSMSVKDKEFYELATIINRTINFRGAWFFQMKRRANGELVLMEIGPRIAGTMGLVRNKGVNLALMSLFDAMDYQVSVAENDIELDIDRALQNSYRHNIKYDHIYLDFDDMVIYEGKINPAIMAFVFQSFNKGKKVTLLTKHKANLAQTLERYHLSGIFDDILWISDEEEKSTYITHKNSIFIDDSFAERKSVAEALGIPTFDSSMIESLMEKF